MESQVFNTSYAGLNAEQKSAVDTIDGPVMVLAGPGTGKTQILSLRIGKILQETDTNPENILCLTYTEAGGVAMRKRLLSLIGPVAHKVNIHTFHSFCNEVIQEQREHFTFYQEFPASDLEKRNCLAAMMDAWDVKHPLKKIKGKARYYYIKPLLNIFYRMKQEGYTQQAFSQQISDYIAGMEFDDNYINKRNGKLKKDYATDKEKYERLLAGINEFDAYNNLMLEKGLYDFEDMLLRVSQAFAENTEMLQLYQERYMYLLVDEFQDTSGVQFSIMQMLASYWDVPNLFVVGDKNQSVYKFQGASVQNFDFFIKQFSTDLKIINLKTNYRSSQKILDASYELIKSRSQSMPDMDANLHAFHSDYEQYSKVEIRNFKNEEYELSYLAEEISAKIASGVHPSGIAVLYRKNAIGEKVGTYLEKKGIPFNIRKKKNALETGFGRVILELLKYVSLQVNRPFSLEGDELLSRLLYARFFNISPIEIGKHIRSLNKLKAESKRVSLRESLTEDSPLYQGEGVFGKERIWEVSKILEELIQSSQNNTLPYFFDEMVAQLNLFEYIVGQSNSSFLMNILTVYSDLIKSEIDKNKKLTLKELVKLLEDYDQFDLSLDVYEQFFKPDGINLITNHSSKGLEFDTVYMIGCNGDMWEGQKGKGLGLSIPPLYKKDNDNETEEENRRLFYVSMTRAKKNLFISYSEQNLQEKGRKVSCFVSELQNTGLIQTCSPQVEEKTIMFYTLAKPPASEHSWLDKHLVDLYWEKETVNVSKINSFLHCPVGFYFNYIIKVPRFMNESMAFGSVVHDILFKFFESFRTNAVLPNEEEITQMVKDSLKKYSQYFTEQGRNEYLFLCQKTVEEYVAHYKDSFTNVVSLEYPVPPVEINGVRIDGRLDKIEFWDNTNLCSVIDYKTGKYKKPDFERAEGDSYGGKYWRQAAIYKLLMDYQHLKNWKVQNIIFDFVEKDKEKYNRISVEIDESDKAKMLDIIKEYADKIKSYSFEGCGQCEWCNIVQEN